MNTRLLLILLSLPLIFFLSYGLLVESPLTTDDINFRAFFTAAVSLTAGTSYFPLARVAVAIMVLVIGRVAIWIFQRVLEV